MNFISRVKYPEGRRPFLARKNTAPQPQQGNMKNTAVAIMMMVVIFVDDVFWGGWGRVRWLQSLPHRFNGGD